LEDTIRPVPFRGTSSVDSVAAWEPTSRITSSDLLDGTVVGVEDAAGEQRAWSLLCSTASATLVQRILPSICSCEPGNALGWSGDGLVQWHQRDLGLCCCPTKTGATCLAGCWTMSSQRFCLLRLRAVYISPGQCADMTYPQVNVRIWLDTQSWEKENRGDSHKSTRMIPSRQRPIRGACVAPTWIWLSSHCSLATLGASSVQLSGAMRSLESSS
jgi:hypothetical protein